MRRGRPRDRRRKQRSPPRFTLREERHLNRRAVVEFLIRWDSVDEKDKGSEEMVNSAVSEFFAGLEHSAQFYSFAQEMLSGLLKDLMDVDDQIVRSIDHWMQQNFEPVELACLRLAVYELTKRDDTSANVAITEATTIARELAPEKDLHLRVRGHCDRIRQCLANPSLMRRPGDAPDSNGKSKPPMHMMPHGMMGMPPFMPPGYMPGMGPGMGFPPFMPPFGGMPPGMGPMGFGYGAGQDDDDSDSSSSDSSQEKKKKKKSKKKSKKSAKRRSRSSSGSSSGS